MSLALIVVMAVGGAVLKFAKPPFFEQAPDTGVILMIAATVLLLVYIIFAVIVKRKIDKFDRKHFGRGW